ncbi:uncharacterized protein BT62DRAFT_1009301 [Guyanagaster necrorhizus]|uniref:Uncharacterized protein n=1 Tax=Guyanagaster necrorhizus TaxID=856835 RepID=A0A9P7VN29_9AGAR|nr:uncharacterized protein BT62DRAFT_1009301 [Guyanagaster necrorhizus MCA 3950]KAG7443487.1 hypothetical protein BT62DRAFT_1009301 [Guyanagaster necrorhizus MCA 3950]
MSAFHVLKGPPLQITYPKLLFPSTSFIYDLLRPSHRASPSECLQDTEGSSSLPLQFMVHYHHHDAHLAFLSCRRTRGSTPIIPPALQKSASYYHLPPTESNLDVQRPAKRGVKPEWCRAQTFVPLLRSHDVRLRRIRLSRKLCTDGNIEMLFAPMDSVLPNLSGLKKTTIPSFDRVPKFWNYSGFLKAPNLTSLSFDDVEEGNFSSILESSFPRAQIVNDLAHQHEWSLAHRQQGAEIEPGFSLNMEAIMQRLHTKTIQGPSLHQPRFSSDDISRRRSFLIPLQGYSTLPSLRYRSQTWISSESCMLSHSSHLSSSTTLIPKIMIYLKGIALFAISHQRTPPAPAYGAAIQDLDESAVMDMIESRRWCETPLERATLEKLEPHINMAPATHQRLRHLRKGRLAFSE